MIRHIVMWSFKDGFTEDENISNAQKIKSGLEALTSEVEGVISLEVIISPLKSSNRDIVLNSLFENEESLAAYQSHPSHALIGNFIGTVTVNRSCIDYVEE